MDSKAVLKLKNKQKPSNEEIKFVSGLIKGQVTDVIMYQVVKQKILLATISEKMLQKYKSFEFKLNKKKMFVCSVDLTDLNMNLIKNSSDFVNFVNSKVKDGHVKRVSDIYNHFLGIYNEAEKLMKEAEKLEAKIFSIVQRHGLSNKFGILDDKEFFLPSHKTRFHHRISLKKRIDSLLLEELKTAYPIINKCFKKVTKRVLDEEKLFQVLDQLPPEVVSKIINLEVIKSNHQYHIDDFVCGNCGNSKVGKSGCKRCRL